MSDPTTLERPTVNLDEIADIYQCSRRHARDTLTKLVGFPEPAPGSTLRNPVWVRKEIMAYLHREGSGSSGRG